MGPKTQEERLRVALTYINDTDAGKALNFDCPRGEPRIVLIYREEFRV